jgi:hypothetical protein
MRPVVLLAVLCLGACAGEKLAQVPPAGVDLSGRWKLNEADSDDPQRLLQAQIDAPTQNQRSAPAPSGGRGGRRGGGADPGAMNGPAGPVMPSVGAISEGLHWPGKQLEIKQVAGVVAFTSDGVNLVCQPAEGGRGRGHGHPDQDGPGGRDAAPRSRDTPPPRCGWMQKTLIVMGGDPDEDRPPFEKHYSLSDDRQRLVEVVGFKGGRSSGFTMSRVWDRSNQ